MSKIFNNKVLKDRRKQLRNNLTIAEASLWKYLKQRKLQGRKFRRQHSIGRYIADFYCTEERLVIELDGKVHEHDNTFSRDQAKMRFFQELGIKVLRFENKLVFEHLEIILSKIEKAFKS